MAGIMALFGVLGAYIGGSSGMLLALLFGGAMNVFRVLVLRYDGAEDVQRTRS